MNEKETDVHSSRRQAIIDFIRKKPECTQEQVVEECNKKGLSSRSTTLKIIQVLKDQGILNDKREKRNSKSYKLTVNSGNLLVEIPQDLNEIFEKFKLFIDKIRNEEEELASLERSKASRNTGKLNYLDLKSSKSLLPYNLIEVINEVYMFYFIVLLPYRLQNPDQINRLYSNYFENLRKMYVYVSNDSRQTDQPFNLDDVKNSNLYKTYVKSKQMVPLHRRCKIVKDCRDMNMENDLYSFLQFLWKKNIDSVILLYQYDGELQEYLMHTESNGIFEYDYEKIFEKIRSYIDDTIPLIPRF